jgi:hypothetical protein
MEHFTEKEIEEFMVIEFKRHHGEPVTDEEEAFYLRVLGNDADMPDTPSA